MQNFSHRISSFFTIMLRIPWPWVCVSVELPNTQLPRR